MLNSISNYINNLWEQWNIRGLILFSLSLQIFLTMCSPLRKRMQKGLLQFSIWVAYLIADWVANFCMGHIASNQISGGNKTSVTNTHNHLLAFWAPFLLMHLGGPDTITAFSLEDNQLWSRHMLGFIIQFTTCAYIFLLTLPQNNLWIPSVLVFVVGLIKYGERIYALYHASDNDEFNIDITSMEPSTDPSNAENDLEETESLLNSLYEGYFTKLKALHSKMGYIRRFITISCVSTALGLFFFNENKEKQGFNNFDMRVTYTLLCGAVVLDTISLLVLLFATFSPLPRILQRFIDLTTPRWSKCKNKPFTKFTELSTWLPFRKWKGSIPGLNVISYCHSMMTTTKYCRCMVPSYYSRYSAIFMRLHVVQNPFLLELWVFFYHVWKRKFLEASRNIHYEFNSATPSEWWIDLILEENSINEDHKKKLMNFLDVKKFPFDSIILMWHIATCLCYMKEKDEQIDEREFSKLLSDYMFYLLILVPNSKSVSEGGQKQSRVSFLKKYTDALSDIMEFFNNDKGEAEACMNLFASDDYLNELLNDARDLANDLWMILPITSIKWKIISLVWIELLSSVAFNYNFSNHLQHISQGGELISIVWVLYFLIYVKEQVNKGTVKVKKLKNVKYTYRFQV